MSAIPPASRSEIPDSLRKQLEEFRKQLWRRKVMEAVAAGLIGLLVSFLLIFGLDRIWQTPTWARLIILVGGVLLCAGFAPYWLHRWVWGHRREDQLAKLISKRFPGLGDRLLGVIELQAQREADDSLSPRLRAAAMEVVAAEAGKKDFEAALPTPRHLKWALGAMVLIGIVATAFLLTPKAGLNALQRWVMPFSDVERYTFTQLENATNYLAVPYGEAFEVRLKLSKDSEKTPETASGQYGLQPELRTTRRGDTYAFRFPGQQESGTVVFSIGDLKHLMKIEPMQRPAVSMTRVLVKAPAYMGISERTVDLASGEISVAEGSELVFDMDMSRPVRSGTYGPSSATGEMAERESFTAAEGSLVISGAQIRTGSIPVGAVPFELPFSWLDEFGLSGGKDFKLRVDAVKDTPSVAYTQGLERQKAILPEESIDFEVLCEDDFGLKQIGIEWESLGSEPGAAPETKGELVLAKGGSEERRLMKPVVFSPSAFGMGPQKLVLRAFSEDFFPGRERSYSESIILYVLSREEHAQLLKSQFDRTISELEDLSRKELNLLDENQRLENLDGEELQKEENQKRVETQEQAENENAQNMEELTEKMEELMKGATRNGDIDEETLKKMAGALKSMQELSQTDMPDVRAELGDAQEPSNTPEKTDQDVTEAVEEQKEVVEKIKKTLEDANDANKRFEASTFVARLKKAASEQGGIAGSLVGNFKNLLGIREDEIDPSDRRKLTETTRQQAITAADVRWIQEDLGHYFARTQEKTFKEILDKMRDSKIDTGLEDVRGKLLQNHTYLATEEAKVWASRLSKWAAILGNEMDTSGGGDGGGGGAPNSEDEDFEFMLRVMKMIQQEQDLRARTRVLEQLKRDTGATAQPNR